MELRPKIPYIFVEEYEIKKPQQNCWKNNPFRNIKRKNVFFQVKSAFFVLPTLQHFENVYFFLFFCGKIQKIHLKHCTEEKNLLKGTKGDNVNINDNNSSKLIPRVIFKS